MIKEVTVYETDDGSQFNTRKEAKKKQDDFNWLIGDPYNPYPTWL